MEIFERIFDLSPDAVLVVAEDGTIVRANAKASEFFGYGRSELVGQPIEVLVPVPLVAAHLSHRAEYQSGPRARPMGVGAEVRAVRKDGTEFEVEVSLSPLRTASGLHVICAARDVSARRAAAEALRESESRYRTLVEHTVDGIFISDVEGRYVDVNTAACRMLGLSREELVRRRIADVVAPAEVPRVGPELSRLEAGESVLSEWRFLRSDGSTFEGEVVARRLPDGRNLAVVRDVTERKRAAEALRLTEERLRERSRFHEEVVAEIHEGIVVSDRELRIVAWNGFMERLTGVPASSVLGRTREEILGGQEVCRRSDLLETLAGATVTSAPTELRSTRGDVRLVVASHSPHRDGGGEIVGIISAVRDVTEERLAEEDRAKLRRSIERSAQAWRMTFDAVETPILLLDLEGVVRQANRAASALAGMPIERFVGTPVASVAPGEPWRTAALLHERTRDTRHGVQTQTSAGFRESTWLVAANRFRLGSGAEERIIVTAKDISGTVALQQKLHRSESLTRMGNIVAGVAHEVRNPLFSISANLDAFEAELGDRAEYRELARTLRNGVRRLEKLMEDLLEYGRPRVPAFEEAPLLLVAEDAVAACEALAARKKVRLVLEAAPDLPPVRHDRRRLAHVLQNLLENAIHHSAAQGVVVLRLDLGSGGSGNHVVLKVEDRGPGIAPEDLPRVFDPFFTKRKGGTGLGLSIVQRIVEEHGGVVAAASREGGGTTMTVQLPLRGPDSVS